MKPHPSKLQHRQKEQTAEQQQQHSEQKTAAREFQSVDEMLRHDAAQTRVPASVKTRLVESVRKEPRTKPRSWWKRRVL